MQNRIEIIEGSDQIRGGLQLLINSLSDHTVVGAYISCEVAIKNLAKDKPDVILMDLDLSGMSGIEGIRRITKSNPDVYIIVFTVYEDSDTVFKALRAGAAGYIIKNSNYTIILDAIKEVQSGGAPLTSKIAKMVVGSFQKNPNSPITSRETEVLELISKGKPYTVIAKELFIHKETVKSHIKNIYFKLQVNTKADALEIARKNKLI